MTGRAPALALLLLVPLVAGCGGGGASHKPAGPAKPAPTALDAVLGEIGPDGAIPLPAARQLFQLAYGGLANVSLPAGARNQTFDGTLALTAMDRVRDQLSPGDQARLDAVEGAGAVSTTVSPADAAAAPTAHRGNAVGLPRADAPVCGGAKNDEFAGSILPGSNTDVGDFRLRVAALEQVIGVDVGEPLGLPVQITAYSVEGPAGAKGKAVADTTTFDASCGGGAPAVCRIRFFTGAMSADSGDRDNTVAHELWHCFEAKIVGDRNKAFGSATQPGEASWIIEGQAEWVGAYETNTASTWWARYLQTSGASLFGRTYSAIGFYASMKSDGAAVFPAFAKMLTAGLGSNTAAFDAAVAATGGKLLDTWGSRFFEAAGNANWDYSPATGDPPGADDGGGIPDAQDLAVGDAVSKPFTVAPHTVSLWRLHPGADLVHLQVPAHGRSLDDGGTETGDLGDVWFCTHEDPKACKCPEGSDGEAPESTYANGRLRVAVTAGDDAGSGTITGSSLDRFCKQKNTGNGNVSAFCADAKHLRDNTQAYMNDPSGYAAQAQSDALWTGKMADDAPADIAGPMKPVAAAYAHLNAVMGGVGYQIVGGPDVIAAIKSGIDGLKPVIGDSQQVLAYVNAQCGFTFTFR